MSKGRLFLILSTTASGVALAASLLAGLTRLAVVLAGILFIAHLLLIGVANHTGKAFRFPPSAIEGPEAFALTFILATSTLATAVGLLSWTLFFIPGSTIREGLIQASPVLGWIALASTLLLGMMVPGFRGDREAGYSLSFAAVVFPVIGYLFFFWLTAQMFSFTVDDAYITFRYSRNLAAGWGPTYNPGQPPVEGYTTFAWMIIMALPHVFGINVPTFSKLAGVLLSSGTFTLASLLTCTLTQTYPVRARIAFGSFAAFLTAMLPITAIHAISGMETSLFTFLTIALVCMVTIGILNRSLLLFWAPLVGLLLGLTRPEGNLIAAILLAATWFLSEAPRRSRLAWITLWLYILPGGAYFAWRALYYQLPFPLPFYMKVLHGGGLGGAGEVASFLHYLLPAISVLVVITILRFRREYALVLLPVGLLLGFYLFPVHAMGFDWRFVYPTAPLVFVAAAVGGATLFGTLKQQISSRLPWEWILFGGLSLVSLGNLTGLESQINAKKFYGAGISNYRALGILLSEFNHDHELTLAIGDAGTAPYYSDWQVIDLFGLNSREIAFGTVPVETLLFEVQPVDLIVLSVGPNRNRISDEHAGAKLLYDQAKQHGMAKVASFSFGRSDYVWVLGYPDSDLAEFLWENLSINLE